MGRKFGGHNKIKKSKTKLKVNNQVDANQISLVAAESSIDREGISVNLGENTLEVESLSETNLPMSQRRSKRTCVTVDTTYSCEICHLIFSTEYNLRRHLDYYGDPKYPCKECGTKFTDKRQLQSHISNAHVRLNPKFSVDCPVCKQMFALPVHLRAHLSHYHEDWKGSIKTEEDPVKCPTEFKTVKIESPVLIISGASCIKDSKKRTKTQCPTAPDEAYLQTQQSVETNVFSSKTVENVTASPASVSLNRHEDEKNKSGERSREEKQMVSTNTQNADVLSNGVECENKGEDITIKYEHPICVNGENEGDYQNPLNDSENKNNQIMREDEQALCLNGENSQVFKCELEDKIDTITRGDGQIVRVNEEKEYDFQSQLQDNEDKSDKRPRENENTVPASEKFARPQTVQITPEELGKPINKGKKPLVAMCVVPSEDEVLWSSITIGVPEETDVNIESNRDSNPCDEADNFHDIRDTAKNAENVTLLDARLDEDKIAATSIDFQEKAQENNGEKAPYYVHNYDEEIELRRLHSCKDCYVPLVRVKLPEIKSKTAEASAELTQSHIEQPHTVIPSIICNKNFADKGKMIQHYRQRHFGYWNNVVHCVCGKRMSGYDALDFHFYRYCQKTVPAATAPKNSRAPCKPLPKKFSCAGCDEMFWLESCLRSHVYNCKPFINLKVQKILTESANLIADTHEHMCHVCCTEFKSKENLLEHEKVYSRPATYRCGFCRTMFPADRQLRLHIKTAHIFNSQTRYNFVCTTCNQGFTNKRHARVHTMHIHPVQVILENNREPSMNNLSPPDSDDPGDDEMSINKCNVCNLEFTNTKRFIDHTIYYTKSEIIHCKTCDDKFEGQYRAHHHNKTVHYSADMQMAFTHHCNICKEGFMYMTHLQAHMFHVHISEANITTLVDQNDRNESESQPNSSQSADSWLYELRDRDEAVPSLEYACTVCDVRFQTQALLAAHESDFADDGEYLCNRCSKKCRTPAMLLDHLTLNHSNNAMQGGVKCRRCNENFLTQRAWVSHVKHFHSIKEPSEFYLEKNVASTEESGDIRYELIPTNDSISSGVTYFKTKSSIDTPKSAATVENNKGADKVSVVADVSRINDVIPEEEKLIASNNEKTEKTDFNVDICRIKVQNPEEDELIINDFNEVTKNESVVDTSTINVAIPHEEQSATNNDEQAVNTNPDFDADRMKMKNPEKKKATTVFWKIRDVSKRNYDKGWNCNTCGYVFRGSADLARHMSLYSDNGHYMCEICGRRFEVSEFYRGHKLSHTYPENTIQYFCTLCNEGFQAYQNMKMHVAHLHPKLLRESPPKVSNKDLAYKLQEMEEARRQSRASARLQRGPEPSFYRSVLPSFVKKADPHLRTYSRKKSNQSAVVVTEGDATNPIDVEAGESPQLHTEIFEDEISLIYECPKCQDKYSTVERLDEHLTAVHRSKCGEKEPGDPSKKSDTHLVCNVCEKVFANDKLLIAHREKLHFIKTVEVVRSSAPVMEITAPINESKTANNERQPIIIGRLYKLEGINVLPKPVDHDKKEIAKKFTVARIVGANAEKLKLFAKTTIKKKADAQVKPPAANAVQLKSLAADDVQLKSLAADDVQLKSVAAIDVQLKFQSPNTELLNLPTAKAEQQNPSKAEQQKLPNAKQQNLPKAEQQKIFATITVRKKAAVQLKSPVANVVQLKSLDADDVQRKSPAAIDVQLKFQSPNIRLQNLPKAKAEQQNLSQVEHQNSPKADQQESPKAKQQNIPKAEQLNLPKAKEQKPPEADEQNLPKAKQQNLPKTEQQEPPKAKQQNLQKAEQQNLPKAEQQKHPNPEQWTNVVKITSLSPVSRSVSSSLNPSNAVTLPIALSPLASIKPIKIVKVESCSSITSTVQPTLHCQFACNTCNTIFMNRSELIEHDKSVHSSTSSNAQSVGNSFAEVTSTKTSMDGLRDLVNTLPVQPENGNDTEEQIPLSFDFESVLIPISTDDFDLSVDESPDSSELENQINPLEIPPEESLLPDNCTADPLKIQSFAKNVENSRKKNHRKRKDTRPIDTLAAKRHKGVFDPVAYEELCRQHNLVLNPKPLKRRRSANTAKSKKNTGN